MTNATVELLAASSSAASAWALTPVRLENLREVALVATVDGERFELVDDGDIASYTIAQADNGTLVATDSGGEWCLDGVASGNACCAASCGTCGGTGCGGRPGGATSCCTSRITAECADAYDTVCVIP